MRTVRKDIDISRHLRKGKNGIPLTIRFERISLSHQECTATSHSYR
jgi:hypothetical protein